MAPLRATDAPGARVMAPSPELFPGGSWERPWVAGEDGEELVVPYEAGGAHATLEGEGELGARARRRAPSSRSRSTAPRLYDLAEHPRHERHELRPPPLPRPRASGRSASPPACPRLLSGYTR